MKKDLILIINDEPKFVRLVSEVMSATGFKVLAAANGEAAIETVTNRQPDLLMRADQPVP